MSPALTACTLDGGELGGQSRGKGAKTEEKQSVWTPYDQKVRGKTKEPCSFLGQHWGLMTLETLRGCRPRAPAGTHSLQALALTLEEQTPRTSANPLNSLCFMPRNPEKRPVLFQKCHSLSFYSVLPISQVKVTAIFNFFSFSFSSINL